MSQISHMVVLNYTIQFQLTFHSTLCGSNKSVSLYIYDVADVSLSQCTTNFNSLVFVSPLLGEVSRDGGGDTKETC